MKSFYEIKKLQAEAQDYGKIAGLHYHMAGTMFVAVLDYTQIVCISAGGRVSLISGDSGVGFYRTRATQKAMNQVLNGCAKVKFSKSGEGSITIDGNPDGVYSFAEGFTFNAETLEVVWDGQDGEYEAWMEEHKCL